MHFCCFVSIKFMITHNRIVSLCIILSMLAACKGKDAEVKEYPKKIVGRWILQKHMFVLNAFTEGAKQDTIIIDETKLYDKPSFKPAEIEYGPEGGYLLVLKNYNDEIKLRRPGLWKFSYDTLVYMSKDSTVTDKNVAEITDSTMTLKGKLDYDDDGQQNDYYEGLYRKLIR
jgi:hypothetical protein